jgi:COP9 signalosome complex subunit 12
LRYLIPTQLIGGVLPSRTLIKKYPSLQIYQGFVDAVHFGNLELFDAQFAEQEKILIKWGTLLVVERTRLLVVRQLFRKIWTILGTPSRISIEVVKRGLEVSMQSLIDVEEVCCLVVNLIDRSYMKGYLSHEKQIIVLSNKDPFPQIKGT